MISNLVNSHLLHKKAKEKKEDVLAPDNGGVT